MPLDKAFQHGYYREMAALIRGLFGQALKTNDYLQFAVLTGCLRVSKESIFTGLNNFKVLSIADARFDEHFGFTDAEVRQILDSYDLQEHFAETKEWYDGYRFGKVDVYCPWDVINHVDRLVGEPDARPQACWINTSGNDLVRRFVDKEAFLALHVYQNAVAMCILQLGELTKQLTPEFTAAHRQIPWSLIAKKRDLYVLVYSLAIICNCSDLYWAIMRIW